MDKSRNIIVFFKQIVENSSLRFLLSNVRFLFFYGIFLFLYELRFFRDSISIIHPVFIVWAMVLILYDFFVRKHFVNVNYWKNIVLFIVSAFITSFLTLEVGIISNIKVFIMVVLPLLVFYPVCFNEDVKERKKMLLVSFLGGSICIFIASIIALWMFIERKSEVISVFGVKALVGIEYYDPINNIGVLLNGIYVDTNHAAAYSLVFSAFSILMWCACKKNIFKYDWQNKCGLYFAVANFLVQICYFPLANSRGGMLCFAVALFLISFMFFYNRNVFKLVNTNRILASFVISTFLVCTSHYSVIYLRESISTFSIMVNAQANKFEENIVSSETVAKEKVHSTKVVLTDNKDNFKKSDDGTGSGRLHIWRDMLVLFCERPIFGTGPNNNRYYAHKYNLLLKKVGNGAAAHNSYLDLLVDYGIVGFICMMSFLLSCLKIVLRSIKKHGEHIDVFYYATLFSVLLVSGVSALLSCVFISTTAMYFILLIMMGYLVAESESNLNQV